MAARVNAVAYFRVVDPLLAITEVEANPVATPPDRSDHPAFVLGSAELDSLLAERDQLNENPRRIIDEQTEPWGIKVTTVEIKGRRDPGDDAARPGVARRSRAGAAGEGHQR